MIKYGVLTEEQVQQAIENLANGKDMFNFETFERDFNDSIGNLKEEPPKESCRHSWMHEWVEYVGFNETYEYCERCDEKRTK